MSPDLTTEFKERVPEMPQRPESTFEVPVTVEKKAEIPQPKEELPKEGIPQAIPQAPQQPSYPQQAAIQKDPELVEVEHILEEHIGELFLRLPENKKQAFKEKGEETARIISGLLRQTTVKVQKLVNAILAWLRMVPGISKFYLEQEATAKANKLLSLKDKNNRQI